MARGAGYGWLVVFDQREGAGEITERVGEREFRLATGARRHLVDRTRDQFLAGARLAADQHRRHAARHLLDQRAHLVHRRRRAGQPRERRAARNFCD